MKMAEGSLPLEGSLPPVDTSQTRQRRSLTTIDLGTVIAVLAALDIAFIAGVYLVLDKLTGATASDVVAILASIVGAISAISAGVFGYTAGAHGTTEAQAHAATADSLRQEAETQRGRLELKTSELRAMAQHVREIATRMEAPHPAELSNLISNTVGINVTDSIVNSSDREAIRNFAEKAGQI